MQTLIGPTYISIQPIKGILALKDGVRKKVLS